MDSLSTYNEYFTKLNLIIPEIDLDRKTKTLANHVKNEDTYHVVMNYVSSKDKEKFLNLIPEKLRKNYLNVMKSSIRELPPHTHGVGGCVINFYCKTNGERTVCYEGDYVEPVDDPSTFKEDSGYYIIDESRIKKVCSYTAYNGDVYLLNTRKAHAVIDTNNLDDSRIIIQIYLNVEYSEAYALLQ
jgi:hypothetical protein